MKITLYLHRNLTSGTAAVVCMFIDALIPAIAPPEHLGWLRWRVPLLLVAVIALVCLAIQLFILSRQEHKREKKDRERDERDKRIDANLLSIQVQVTGKSEVHLKNEANLNVNPQFTPKEHLQNAEEAVWVEDAIEMSPVDLKMNLAHDPKFRSKFSSIPPGKYTQFDAVRESIAKDPIIAARMIRSRLVPREPFAQQINEVFNLMKKPYTSTSDFLFEIHLVNVTDNSTTVDAITAEAEIEGKWTLLKMADLSNYEIAFDDEQAAGTPFSDVYAEIKELPSLWDQIKGVTLTRGIAKQGWIDFEVHIPSTQLENPVQHKVRIVDALGGIHPVLVLDSKPLDQSGRIKHSNKVYAKLHQP